MAHRAAAQQLFAQFDHAIDHGVLGAAFIEPGTGQQQHGTAGKSGMPLQFGNELLGVQCRFRADPGVEHAVNDQQAGLLPADFLAEQFDHRIEPLLFKGIEGADELDLVTDQRRVEEPQGRQVLKKPFMGLAEQGGNQYSAAVAHMTTGQLVGENGLAGARRPLNDV
ncbi:hypothetical protein D3C79_693550 [compost metagenome]